jgi:hypothetical protein
MKNPDLTPDELREIFTYEPDTGKLFWNKCPSWLYETDFARNRYNTLFAGKEAGGVKNNGYKNVMINKRKLLSHRVIWAMVNNKWPDFEIDHINHNPSDNRLLNLRMVTRQENQKNRSKSKNNISGHTGVYFNQNAKKWEARVKNKYLGCYDNLEDAAEAAKLARTEHNFHPNHGE